MKALISASLILLFIASCGSSSKETYAVTDDNNGTKSPRVKEIITETADRNRSEDTITRYTYNDENLLISEKKSYVQKPKEDDTLQFMDSEITYTYTQDKQLKTRHYTTDQVPDYSAHLTTYTYGDILYKKTKLPVVDTVIEKSRYTNCTYKHTYHLDASNFATSINKISQACTSSMFQDPPSSLDFHPKLSADEDKIYSANLSKHTEQYTYFSQSATATYDKGLREKVEYYSPDETNASKEPELERTSTYIYEEKPYFYKESSSPMVNLPH